MKQKSQFLKNQTQRYAVMGILFGLLFPIVATIIRIAVLHLPFGLTGIVIAQSTDPLLWIIDTAPLFLGLFASLAGRRQDVLEALNSELMTRENELRSMQSTLEQRVEQRTEELALAHQKSEKRARQLQTIAEIAHEVISIRSVDKLMPQLSQKIGNQVGYYHVGIFLIDELGQDVILSASNSEGGLRMLQRGYRVKVGTQDAVGFAAQGGRALIALDIGDDAVSFDNPDLPMTRSEMALPLKSGDTIIGVMDIQSTEENAFAREDIATLSILADQVGIAIQNAILYERAQSSLREAEMASSQLTGIAWKGYAESVRAKGYRYDGIRSEPLGEAHRTDRENDALLIPIQLRGQTIGRLKLQATNKSRQWSEDELAMIDATAERVALALEGGRLLEDAQKRVVCEAFLSDLATKLGATFQLDSIMRDTVEELGQALKDSTVSFQLLTNLAGPTSVDSHKPDGHRGNNSE